MNRITHLINLPKSWTAKLLNKQRALDLTAEIHADFSNLERALKVARRLEEEIRLKEIELKDITDKIIA